VRDDMSLSEDFISKVCNAFRKAVESASEVTIEGREREFRHVLARYLFDETLGWEGHSKIGEIYDITCFDDENFPIIDIETKWGIEPTSEIKEKLRKRIEELGSVKYGVFSSERNFIVYEYADYKLKEITKINVAEATGVARGEYGLSEEGKKRILKLEMLKRERLVWVEDPDYFEKTFKEISVAKMGGVELLTENLKDIVKDLSVILMNFFDSYMRRKDHYSGKFLKTTFSDWLRLSMRDEGFKKGNETEKRKLVEVFCRETSYVLLGKILFTRICEDKGVTKQTISGKGLAESLRYYATRRINPYTVIFDEAREEIKKYYTHFYELGYFDWWWISPEKIGVLGRDDKRVQDALEEELNDRIKRAFRRFNRFNFTRVNRDILGDVYQRYLPPNERKQLGEFYTPKEIIQYILDSVEYVPEKEIRGKGILDPACGSGGFLVEAVQRLTERYRRTGFNLKDPDDAKQVIEGCISSIYGLDIHPFACFIAEMNLLFQLVDLYDTVRQKYRYYTLQRLNIFITDSLMPSGETVIELVEFVDNSRRKMLLEETKGANKVKTIKFDYVVENPPYVHQKGKKGMPKISFQYREQLRKHYTNLYTGKGTRGGIKVNLFAPFIERSIRFLKENSKFGFIVHKNILKVESYKLLREYILETCQIEKIVDLGAGIFEDVTGETCIIILQQETDENKRKNNDITVITGINARNDLLIQNFQTHNVKQESFYTTVDSIFPIYIHGKFLSLKHKIERNKVKLDDAVKIVSFGLNTIDNKKYVSDRKVNEKYKKALMGRDIDRYLVKNKNRYVLYDPEVLSRIGDEKVFLATEKIIMQRIGQA
jgi:type I restriction-modification system DNA methylase subunit